MVIRPYLHNAARLILTCAVALTALFATDRTVLAQGGTWTQLKNPNPQTYTGTMLLLTDGTVMANPSNVTTPTSAQWARLSPDLGGNYVNGTWTQLASMSTPRFSFPSNMLTTGKVFLLGGEYSGNPTVNDWNNTGEIYDPIANSWSPIQVFPEAQFGDVTTQLLPNGLILAGSLQTPSTYLYNPTTNKWTQTGTKLRNDQSDEESWCLLPDGSVLSYDVFASPDVGPGSAQRYIPSKGQWVDAGVVPVPLSGSGFGYELGPLSLLPDGRVFIVGANNNTALYSPSTNTWTAGPTLPANMGADDAPGCMLPNGKFIFAADFSQPNLFSPPVSLFEFDYLTNTITDVTPGGALGAELANLNNGGASSSLMLMLPNGHMLMTNGQGTVWDFAPTGTPKSAWAPTVKTITKGTGANANIYTLTGTQLTGISEGASFGDDAEMSTNYPIIRLTDASKRVRFARTFNWTPGVATGAVVTSVQFTLPGGIPNGSYQLQVIANGIASSAVAFNLPFSPPPPNYNFVTANYDSGTKTLTLTGDAAANSVAITQRGSILTVAGAGLTQIIDSKTPSAHAQQYSYSLTGDVLIVGNFAQSATPPTSDSVSLVSVSSSNTNLAFGSGADAVTISYGNFGTLTINGGTSPAGNPNVVTLVSTKVTTKQITNAVVKQ